jgi:O-antigen/teichoic acid export membrane protein
MEILNFGKWIFVSSVVYFLSVNFDKLYLGGVVPLNMLGVYGIARAISDLLGNLVARLGNYVLFPFIVSHSQMPRADLRAQLAPLPDVDCADPNSRPDDPKAEPSAALAC